MFFWCYNNIYCKKRIYTCFSYKIRDFQESNDIKNEDDVQDLNDNITFSELIRNNNNNNNVVQNASLFTMPSLTGLNNMTNTNNLGFSQLR